MQQVIKKKVMDLAEGGVNGVIVAGGGVNMLPQATIIFKLGGVIANINYQ